MPFSKSGNPVSRAIGKRAPAPALRIQNCQFHLHLV